LDVGAGSIAALVVTLGAGPLLNRRGSRPFLIGGSALYACAGCLMLLMPNEAAMVAARVIQGAGAAVVVPSAYAAIPALTSRRQGSAIGLMSTLGSLPLAIGPPLGLALYQSGGAKAFLLPVIAAGVAGALAGAALRLPQRPASEPPSGLGFDRRWSVSLTANLLNGVYFGGLVAYLPLVLHHAHAPNAGLFFTADAIGVVLLRIPSGMLADRTSPGVPMLLGLAITVLGLLSLIPTTTILTLVMAGAGTGIGAGLFANGLLGHLLSLSRASNRGTAMSLSVATLSLGVFAGSTVSGLLIAPGGFDAVIALGLACVGLGMALSGGELWKENRSARPGAAETTEM